MVACSGDKKNCERTCQSDLSKADCCIWSQTNSKCNLYCNCPNNGIWDDIQQKCVTDITKCCKFCIITSRNFH